MTNSDGGSGTGAHYERLASSYNRHWTYDPVHIDWMARRLAEHAALRPGDTVADIGCGTGLYSRELARVSGHVLCADPSEAMLSQVPDEPSLTPVLASAQDIATGRVPLPGPPTDAIVIKEAVHHIPTAEREGTLCGLAALLRPGGRIVVAMLPVTIGYPLFASALARFERDQPDPRDIAAALSGAGLDTELTYEGYDLVIPKDRYLGMVRDRYMSLLSSFTDTELEGGITEISQRYPGPDLNFTDRFAFISALKP